MKRIRFDLDLSDKDFEGLNLASERYHRSRKNLCEAIIKLAITEFKKYEGTGFIDLRQLGEINNEKEL